MKTTEAVEAEDGVQEIAPDRVAARAYELYVARGRQDGHDVSDWLQAEAELREESDETASPRRPRLARSAR
jgi:hypothetical protein